MYDNIKMLLEKNLSGGEIEKFCTNCNLRQTTKEGVFDNQNERNLKQGKGIYIKLEIRETKAARITIECSLHKLYNEITSGTRQNWNDFNFMQANQAAEYLSTFVGMELGGAKILRYEIGINIKTEKAAEIYFKELESIIYKGREMRILEDVKYKEYKQYSTNRSKDKRIVYVFYDKSHEAKSKAPADKRNEIPNNIIRIEMKVKRIDGSLKFATITDKTFERELLKDFAMKLKEGIKYKTKQKQPPRLTPKQFEMYKEIKRIGVEKAAKAATTARKENKITKWQYYYKLQLIKELSAINEELETVENEIQEFKALIFNKLKELEKLEFSNSK